MVDGAVVATVGRISTLLALHRFAPLLVSAFTLLVHVPRHHIRRPVSIPAPVYSGSRRRPRALQVRVRCNLCTSFRAAPDV